MNKVEYDERMEFTNIFWDIRNTFLMNIQILDPFNKLTEEQWNNKKDQLILHMITQRIEQIKRFAHLYRKYNMQEHY